jgi:hypothetical protein
VTGARPAADHPSTGASAFPVAYFTKLPDIEAGEPEYQVNNFIHGVHGLPARWTPTA